MSFLVGRGIADVTGEPAECGMLGYGMRHQRSEGIHNRLRARAFVIAEDPGPRRVVLVVCDLPLMFDTVRSEVLRRLEERHGDAYTDDNLVLSVTHTHCGPGGYSGYGLYDATSDGFRPITFGAIVDGIVEAVDRAHADVAPAVLSLAHGELGDASVNRSRPAFERNPAADKAFFPDGIDPQTSLLRIQRDGQTVGAVNWFATHGTSMTNRNRLISGDNKGYAGYAWERLAHGVDYRGEGAPAFVGAFAQTNAGDMSPNLGLRPGAGPTADEFENARIIGERQQAAAAALAEEPGAPLTGGVDSRLVWVDLGAVTVRPEFTGDGREHRTTFAVGGAAAMAGASVDGPAFKGFREGRNPLWDQLSRQVVYRFSRRWRDAQSPKALFLPAPLLNRFTRFVSDRAPIQLVRIGRLYLIAIPGEATIVAGLRLRRTVAAIVGAEVADVLVMGYSNAYIHYVTTPEEYDAQRYEGASTVFGRWELPALQQIVAELAGAMRDGRPVSGGLAPPAEQGAASDPRRPAPVDEPVPGRGYGDTLADAGEACRPGGTVAVTFVGAYPNHDLHRGGTYLEVQRQEGDGWRTVADDGDWETRLRWSRVGESASAVTITWHVPAGAVGPHRVVYHGDARDRSGRIRPFAGASRVFEIRS